MIAQAKDLKFVMYWNQEAQQLEPRIIGNLRYPDEVVELALETALDEIDTDEIEGGPYVHVANVTVTVGLKSYNEIIIGGTKVETFMDHQYETHWPPGALPGETIPDSEYVFHQDKGWVTLDSGYFSTSDEKPDNWGTCSALA